MKKSLLLAAGLVAFATAGTAFGKCHTCKKPSRYGYERTQHGCKGKGTHKGGPEADARKEAAKHKNRKKKAE